MKNTSIIMVLMLAGCSAELPNSVTDDKKNDRGTKTTLNTKANNATNDSEGEDFDDLDTTTPEGAQKALTKYLKLKAQNDQLCLRVQKQRIQCPLVNPLVADDSEKVLGCVAGVDKNAKVSVNYSISVTPPSGYKIYLSTKGGSWQTNEVGAGDNQKLEWKPGTGDKCFPSRTNPANAQSQIRAPKILELNDLMVKLVPDNEANCNSETRNRVSEFGNFELRVNNVLIFSKPNLTYKDRAHQVVMTNLDSFLSKPECVVPKSEIDDLLQKALENFSGPSENAKTPDDIDERYSRETSRNQSLRLALSGPEKLGCWAFSKIEKLEVRIEGAALNKSLVKKESEKQGKDTGNPDGFTFNFGDGMKYAVAQEKGIFKPGGGFVTDAFAGKTIQELRLFSIKKQGTSFDSQEFRKTRKCGFLNLSTCSDTRYKVYETGIRSMASIKIIVNDQVIYENNSAKFTFDSKHKKWPKGDRDENIQENAKFRELMRLSSCPAG